LNKFTLVIPAYNEANRLGSTLDQLSRFLEENGPGDVEVLVVVADSPDGTVDVARSKAGLFKHFRVIEAGLRAGKGRDVRLAMLEAKGEYKLFMDADLATPLHHLNTVFRQIREKADVIIGVRDLLSSHTGLRKFISMAGNLLVRFVLGVNIKDTQCGFKAFRGSVADDLFGVQTINGWGFDMELLTVARQRGYNIRTIPIHDWKDVDGGTFQNTAIRGALSTLKDLMAIRWNLFTGRYKSSPDPAPVLQES